MQYVNLFLAFCWLAIGGGLLYWHEKMGQSAFRIPIGDDSISSGWVALLLALYNLVRFWSIRAANHRRSKQHDEAHLGQRMERLKDNKTRETPIEPDPNFNFNDPAAAPSATNPPERQT